MKYQIFKPLLALLFVLSIVSCKKNDDLASRDAEDLIDISYGLHEQNTLDVYLPAGRTDTTKVVILLHGGAWVAGDKDSLTEHAMNFRDRGFAVVNMNYRLVDSIGGNTYPAQKDDITQVLNYITSKIPDWNVSASKFAMVGVSAGAHLALHYTYAFNASNKIKTVVSLAGPTNFTDFSNINTPKGLEAALAASNFLGHAYDIEPAVYVQASPLSKVSSLSKPTLIIHGTYDEVVPIKQATDLDAKLATLGVPHKLQSIDSGHDLLENPVNAPLILDEIELWINEHAH